MQPLAAPEQALIAAIDPAAMLEQTLAWSAINTGTRNLAGLALQTERLVACLSGLPGDLCLEAPAAVPHLSPDGTKTWLDQAPHLVLRVRPKAERRLLLTGHMDTVFAADDPFQQATWLDADMINGPGVADMKGGIAVMLAALAAFEASPAAGRIGYDVLINSDEETGSLSSAPLIAQLAKGAFAALTYEPATLPDGTLAGARRGSGNFSLLVHGRSAHAGRNPQDGRNAIVAAAALTLGLKALEHAGLSVNPARIDGGSANNIVPDLAILRFNMRPETAADLARFEMQLADLVAATEREHDVRIVLQGGVTRPPKPLDPRAENLFHLVRDCGAALGQPIRWQATGGVCDGNNIAACGVPVVDTMGVRGGAIHSSDEYLIVSSLVERAALSALVLHRIAEGASL